MTIKRLFPQDEHWPSAVDVIDKPPQTLFVRGNLPPLSAAVAIVGTRFSDLDAMSFTRRLAADLARCGIVVISGGARGIDEAAHEGALGAGGKTVAVLASGLDYRYAPRRASLFERISKQGALLTELPLGTPPRPGRFLDRNRLIAGLSKAVVVTRAPFKSGSLSTARHAQRQSKPVFAVPATPWDPYGQGTLKLLRNGAYLCQGALDVCWRLGIDPPEIAQPDADSAQDLRGAEILHRLKKGACLVEEIAQDLGWSIQRAQQELSELEAAGIIVRRQDHRYAPREGD